MMQEFKTPGKSRAARSRHDVDRGENRRKNKSGRIAVGKLRG